MEMNLTAYKHRAKGIYAVIYNNRVYLTMLDGTIFKEMPKVNLRMSEFEDTEYEYQGNFLDALNDWEAKQKEWNKFKKK